MNAMSNPERSTEAEKEQAGWRLVNARIAAAERAARWETPRNQAIIVGVLVTLFAASFEARLQAAGRAAAADDRGAVFPNPSSSSWCNDGGGGARPVRDQAWSIRGRT